MDALASSSEAAFTDRTGFTLGSVVDWMWTNLLEPVLGGGLAVVYELRYVIVAIASILVILYIAKRIWAAWHA